MLPALSKVLPGGMDLELPPHWWLPWKAYESMEEWGACDRAKQGQLVEMRWPESTTSEPRWEAWKMCPECLPPAVHLLPWRSPVLGQG